jgi:ATP-binding cassette subfamily C protein
LASAGFYQVFLDNILLEGHVDWLAALIVAMLVTLFIQACLRLLQLRHLRRLKLALSMKLSSRFMWHLLHLPAAFYAQRFSGELANRSRLNDKLAGVLSGRLAQSAIDFVMMAFYAAMMFYYDRVLTSVGVGVGVVNMLVLRWTSMRRVESNMRVLQEYGKAQGTSLAGLHNMETIKSAGVESRFFEKWAGHYASATNARQDLELSNQTLSVVPTLLNSVATTIILTVGAYRIINGDLTIGMLVAFQSLTRSFLAPISDLVKLGGVFQELQGDLDRVDDVLAHPADQWPDSSELRAADGKRIVRLKGYVELRGVTFGYNPLEEPLISDFNLTIRPGQRVALVGASGSGKSTLLKLISGELKAWEGQILFDHLERDQIPLDVLVNSFAIVEQDIFLFAGTVRENLTLWDRTVPDRDLVRACEDAMIHDVVLELPGGYDGEVLEGGANLSGGQAQRMELARALVNKPSLLVLDEATSALDADTERVVFERLRPRACSCIIVSHRLSTIRDCDEIIVLKAGTVVERGTHEGLRAANGEYASLIRTGDDLVGEEG